ncbi:MAG: peptide ABC transporter substrate-binding protein [Sporichthyaceae bacterium]
MRRPGRTAVGLAGTGLVLGGLAVVGESTASAAAPSIKAAMCAPFNPLTPGMVDQCGGLVLSAVTRHLIRHNASTGKAALDLAEKISTSDARTFTVKLRAGQVFSDGKPIRAKNFVNAWNVAARGDNAYLFDPIAGSGAVVLGKSKTLSGLKVKDDRTFTITLSAKNSAFRQRLGHLAYSPVPDSFFADSGKAFGKKPIGAGPFRVVSGSAKTGFVLKRNTRFAGARKPTVGKVTFKVYDIPDQSYAAVQLGEVDLVNSLPLDVRDSGRYRTELAGRWFTGTAQPLTYLAFPSTKAYKDVRLRQAISMAVDRAGIAKERFGGTYRSADGWVGPQGAGYAAGACGGVCKQDADKAKAQAKAAGFAGTLTIAYNGDSTRESVSKELCESIAASLGRPCKTKAYKDFTSYREAIDSNTITSMWLAGWIQDYPSIEGYLSMWRTGDAANETRHSDKTFDAAMAAAAAKPKLADAEAGYRKAHARLRSTMPSVPLHFFVDYGARSTRIKSAAFDVYRFYDFASVVMK